MAGKALAGLALILGLSCLAAAGDGNSKSDSPVREAAKVLNPKDRNIGRYIKDIEFQDVAGTSHRLSEFASAKATVIAVTSTSCPLSKKYLPTLVRLAQKYNQNGIRFVLVNPVATDKTEAIQQAAKQLGKDGLYVHDKQGQISAELGLTSTTDAILLDPARTVRYHGAVDDQYGFGYAVEAPRKNYLVWAIEEFQSGHPLVIAATEAPGCHLDAEKASSADTSITYHNRISRLVQMNCGECHRDGGVAPFSLSTSDDLLSHAKMIETVVTRGTMPPWFAVPTAKQKSNPWVNDCSLSDSDKKDLLAWLKGDHPLGDPKDAPVAAKYSDGWTIGTPDLVVKFPEPVPIQATGFMRYKNITVETGLDEDKWVQGIEIRPGAPEVVHHILVFARPPRVPNQKGSAGDEINYWGIYVPGNNKQIYSDGFARKLPKGSQIRFQMHYTPNGKETEDTTQMGLVFADKEPANEVKTASLVNAWFEIPPGADNHEDSAKFKLQSDVTVMGYLPHMHLRGKACRYEAITPDGKRETLLDIPRYDFNWQLLYRYSEPRVFTKGTILKFYASFDNSDKNPANPNPKMAVRWGDQTYDEMLLGYIEYFVPVAKPGDQVAQGDAAFPVGFADDRDDILFMSLDANDDDQLSREELDALTKNPRFKQANPLVVAGLFVALDKNHDGVLSLEEFKNFRTVFQRNQKGDKNKKKS